MARTRIQKRKCKGRHEPGIRLVPELDLHCRIGRCIVCGEWFSLGDADEPVVDVSAAWIISGLATGEPRGTNSEQSGMAGELRFYGTAGWDAGWLAGAWLQHDALQREEWPASGAEVVAAGRAAGITIEDALAMLEANGRQVDCVEPSLTVTIDSDGAGVAAQINGLCEAPPMFAPDEAEALADELHLGADAARQANQDGYHGPAVVMELLIGDDPDDSPAVTAQTIEPHPDTLAAPPRSWPPGTGCETEQQPKACAYNECNIRGVCTRVAEICRGNYPKLDGRRLDPMGNPCRPVIEPHPETLAQQPRSWPPNTGCDDVERDAIVKLVIDPVGGTTYCDGSDLDTALRDNAEAVRDLAAMIKPGDE